MIRAALLLFSVFLLGVYSAETHLPPVRLGTRVVLIGPDGKVAGDAARLVMADTCREVGR